MRGRTHQSETVRTALALSAKGLSDYAVAERIHVPRSTVQKWRRSGPPVRRPRRREHPITRPVDDAAYSYVLGMYLGDGCLSKQNLKFGLQITLDANYPFVIAECKNAIEQCLPVRARVQRPRGGAVRIWAFDWDWPNLFPQHGPGRKHERKIELVPWQSEITRRYTREFIRG